MPIDLALLRTFLAVADLNGFLPASEKVGRSPSAVSMQIKRLEETLGVELFTRNARETSLTRDGEQLVNHARQLLSAELEMRNAFRAEPVVGHVRLGVPDDVIERFPMQVLKEFSEQYPDVSVTIRVDHTPSLLRSVERGETDIAIVTYLDSIPGIEKASIFYQESEVWAVRKGGTAHKRKPLPVTLWDVGWGWFDRTKSILDNRGVNYRVTVYTENITARRNAIEADLCVGPLPVSQLTENLTSVPELMALDALPTYALAVVKGEAAGKPVDILEVFLKQGIAY